MPGPRGRKPGTTLQYCQSCLAAFTSEESRMLHEEACSGIMLLRCSVCEDFYDATQTQDHFRSEKHKGAVRQIREQRHALPLEAAAETEPMAVAAQVQPSVGPVSAPTPQTTAPPSPEPTATGETLPDPLSGVDSLSLEMPTIAPQPWFAPYSSEVMALIRHWQLRGVPISETKIDELLHLFKYLVAQYGDDVTLWPQGIDDVHRCEQVKITDRMKKIRLPSGGTLYVDHVHRLLQDEFGDPGIYDNLVSHWDGATDDGSGEIWLGAVWQRQQSKIPEEAVYFPHIFWSDKTKMFRKGKKTLHPVISVPAGLRRSMRRDSKFKRFLALITLDAKLLEALQALVQELRPAEIGLPLRPPRGLPQLVVFRVLCWLADHDEGNAILSVYPKACRQCVTLANSETGEERVMKRSPEFASRLVEWARPGRSVEQIKAYEQGLQQYIAFPAVFNLSDFEYVQVPLAIGHSDYLGRWQYHLRWEMQDMPSDVLEELDRRIAYRPKFPGLVGDYGIDQSRRFSTLLKTSHTLTADEVLSLSCCLPFLTLGLLSADRQDLVLAHTEHSTAYQQDKLSKEELDAHDKLWAHLEKGFQTIHKDKSTFKRFPKMHDPKHDRTTYENFKSFRNIDELAIGEKENKFSDRSQLRSQQTSIEDHYQNIVHPGVRVAAETPTCLRGSTSVEDWTVPAMDYKLAALRTATGMTTEELRDAAVAVRIRPSLHITGFRHDIHAVAVHRSTEGFDGVLLQSGAVAHFGVLPWARLAELVEIDFGDDETRSFALIDCPRWNDPERPLDPDTGAPWLRFEGNFLLIPVAYIDRKLWLWHDIRERTAEVVLANWWVTVGDFRYPEHRRRTVQTELGWRREFYAARVPD
eukprot:TRINITY_DN2046_c1_g1_i9.p1 TRINITY_DN2046_c1_g1~~TRINITY_DN2046_c1_g1_i9.p1  ORF type:complete len:865 (-),score=113.98 TRINITY_DN2046_c1_g1_i9:184-2778(-)